MATKSQEILLKGNTTNASAVPSSLKVREIAINALDRSLFTNDGNNIVKLYTGTTKWFDVNGNANNALKLGGILASEYINKEAFNSHINNSTIHITAAERIAWNNKWDYNEETIKAVKVNAAVLADAATKLQTARTLWGQSFDGNDNVEGDLSVKWSKIYWNNDTNNYYIGWNNSEYAFNFVNYYGHRFYSGGRERLRITIGGNVLIGTTTDNGYKLDVNGTGHYSGDLICGGEVVAVAGEGTPVGVTDYSALTGKPAINGVTLVSGNNTLASLGIQAAGDYATNSGVATLLADYAKKTFVSNNYVGKSAFNAHIADTNIHITAEERIAWNAKWNYDEATIKAVKVTSASSADSVAWSGIKDKPTNLSAFNNDVGYITGITKSMVEGVLTGNITSHTHSYLPLSGGTLTSSDAVVLGLDVTNDIQNAFLLYHKGVVKTQLGYIVSKGSYIYDYSTGIYLGIDANGAAYCGTLADVSNNYHHLLLHSGNYNSYSPTLTGAGASGTWGINISGNAASATKLQTPHTIWGQSFDGTGDVWGGLEIHLPDNWNYITVIQPTSNGLTINTFENGVAYKNIILNPDGGNILIGTTTDNGYRLNVNGRSHISGDLIVDGEVSALVA